MPPREVNAYVYQMKLNLPEEHKDLNAIFNINLIKNLVDNAITLGEGEDAAQYLLIVDKKDGNFLCGRFVRLSDLAPRKLNWNTKREREVALRKGENLENISHFIWNVKDRVMFGEYNYHAIRIFTSKLTEYLNELFRRRWGLEILAEVPPKYDEDALRRLASDLEKKHAKINRIDFRVVQENQRTLERHFRSNRRRRFRHWFGGSGRSISNVLTRGKKGYEHYLSISITSHWNEGVFDDGEVLKFAEWAKHDEDTKGMKVTAGENVYDIIKGDYLRFPIKCQTSRGNLSSNTFYTGAKAAYNKEIGAIISAMKWDQLSPS